jgi:hypothetical protein
MESDLENICSCTLQIGQEKETIYEGQY